MASLTVHEEPPGAATDNDIELLLKVADMFVRFNPADVFTKLLPAALSIAVVINAGTPRFNPELLCVITIFVPAVVCVPEDDPAKLCATPTVALLAPVERDNVMLLPVLNAILFTGFIVVAESCTENELLVTVGTVYDPQILPPVLLNENPLEFVNIIV
jgi:hypothetical protein